MGTREVEDYERKYGSKDSGVERMLNCSVAIYIYI